MRRDLNDFDTFSAFIADLIRERSPLESVRVSPQADGSLRFDIQVKSLDFTFFWSEDSPITGICNPLRDGYLCCNAEPNESDLLRKAWTVKLTAFLSEKINRLLDGEPPALLQWRNRHHQTISWGIRLFPWLFSGLIKKGRTRFGEYTLIDLNEYEGYLNLVFESRQARVAFRLSPKGTVKGKPVCSRGPLELHIMEDTRSHNDLLEPFHAIEQFMGYVLARCLPKSFSLIFEGNDVPAGLRSPEVQLNFLNTEPPVGSSIYETIFTTSPDIVTISACDHECFNMFSFIAAPRESWLTVMPWSLKPRLDFVDHGHNVLLSNRSIIMGSDEVEHSLAQLDHLNPSPEMAIFVESCIPRMIGLDLEGPVNRFQRKNTVPLIPYKVTLSEKQYLDTFREFWVHCYEQMADKAAAPESDVVSLFGITDDTGDLVYQLLEQNGVRCQSNLFPLLDVPSLRNLPKSSLLVVNEWEYIEVLFSDLIQKLNRPVLRLPLPYGIEGSLLFVREIVKRLHDRDLMSLDQNEQLLQYQQEFQKEKERIEGERVAIILKMEDLPEQLLPGRRFGLPFIDLLHELGLAVDCLVYVPDATSSDLVEPCRAAGLKLENGDRCTVFRRYDDLTELLHDGEFKLVYSEAFRDRRITSAGKFPINLKAFQPGFSGAVATARRIAKALEMNFYKNHGYRLTSPVAHLRPSEKEERNGE